MDLLLSIVVGLIAGWLAGVIMKGSGYGMIGDIVIGAIGGVIGGWIFGFLGIAVYGTLGAIIVAIVGAIVLIYIVRMVAGSSK